MFVEAMKTFNWSYNDTAIAIIRELDFSIREKALLIGITKVSFNLVGRWFEFAKGSRLGLRIQARQKEWRAVADNNTWIGAIRVADAIKERFKMVADRIKRRFSNCASRISKSSIIITVDWKTGIRTGFSHQTKTYHPSISQLQYRRTCMRLFLRRAISPETDLLISVQELEDTVAIVCDYSFPSSKVRWWGKSRNRSLLNTRCLDHELSWASRLTIFILY